MFGQNTDLEHEVTITVDGAPLDMTIVELVEFMFGDLRKVFPSDDVIYKSGKFYVHLTQEETQSFSGSLETQVRVKFTNGNVPLAKKKTVWVEEALSKEIL